MKKLYFLNEEEKNRILNLHESATKRQYLGEQQNLPFGGIPSVDDVNPLSAKNLIPGLKREDNWKTTYSCVPSQGVKPSKLSDGSTAYLISGVTYYNNGRKKLANGTMAGYTCSTEFKNKSTPNSPSSQDKAKKAQQYKQQIVTKTTDTTKQIQRLLGLTETGVMDSGLLQKINDKLNGGGTSSTPATSSSAPATSSTPASASTQTSASTQAYNFNVDPNIGKGGINFNQMTPEQIAQGVQSATPPQESIAATTPPTNKEKRQERRDLRAANRAEMQALRDKQRGNQ
jgi:hypothetical protein